MSVAVRQKQLEKKAADRVGELLKKEFNLKPYIAIQTQSLDDIMVITKELRSSDYFLFIDFKLLSVFTHQEFALAHHLGFGADIIALRQNGAGDMKGFLKYVLSNPTKFDTVDQLLEKIRGLVKAKGWNPAYSRNLVVAPTLSRSGGNFYSDHTGQAFHETWKAKITNNRLDAAAFGAICILDSIQCPSGDRLPSTDRGYLKWVGHQGYERTILPKSSEDVDLFAVRPDHQDLFLLSTLDARPRRPIVTENGDYELSYRIFARDFPPLEFTVSVNLRWEQTEPVVWTNQSDAKIKQA